MIYIFEKYTEYSLFAVRNFPQENLFYVGKYDARFQPAVYQYSSKKEQIKAIRQAIQSTKDRGWELVYIGDRNYG